MSEASVAVSVHPGTVVALQALRGIGFLTVVPVVTDVGDLRPFVTARQFMSTSVSARVLEPRSIARG